jgi:hypothetical protein
MKRFFQLFSFLGLALIFTAASANGQTEYAGEVDFPFAFSVGEREYAAGKYGIKVNQNQNGTATVVFEDLKNNRVQVVLARRNGDAGASEVSLVFEKVGENRFLTRVNTPGGGMAVGGSPNQARIAAANARELHKPGVVHVNDLD